MTSVNKAILVGRLGKDPEIRSLPNGEAVANLSLATSTKYKSKVTGELVEETEWHRIIVFGKNAGKAASYLHKGSRVYLEGRIKTKKYQGKDGIERYCTDIVCDVLQFLDSKQDSTNSEETQQPEFKKPISQASKKDPIFSGMDDDIPF